jgi:hypothetical protein
MNTSTTNLTTLEVIGNDDDFLSELEAELNAGSIDFPDVEEIGTDELIAAEAEDEDDLERLLAADLDFEDELSAAEEEIEDTDAAIIEDTDVIENTDATIIEDADIVEDVIVPKKKAKAKVKADSAGEPEKIVVKRQSLSGMLPSVALRTALGDRMYKLCIVSNKQASMIDSERNAAIDDYLTGELDVLAKKVKEKAINAFQSACGQSSLSVFTQIAIDLLKDKGVLTGADIKNRYLARPYSPGTASAQSSQLMQLLPVLGIAKRSGNTLELNVDSPLLALLSA